MTRLVVACAAALGALALSMPAPALAKSKADGIRNVETTDFSARRYWRGRGWYGPRYRWGYRGWRVRRAWPVFPLAFAAAAAAPYAYYGPRYYWGPRYYRPAYYYPRYRYWRRPGVSISFGFGPRWW